MPEERKLPSKMSKEEQNEYFDELWKAGKDPRLTSSDIRYIKEQGVFKLELITGSSNKDAKIVDVWPKGYYLMANENHGNFYETIDPAVIRGLKRPIKNGTTVQNRNVS